MNRDALLYIALSAFLLIIGQLTGRYILKKVYASAGVTQSNVLAYRASVAGSSAPGAQADGMAAACFSVAGQNTAAACSVLFCRYSGACSFRFFAYGAFS